MMVIIKIIPVLNGQYLILNTSYNITIRTGTANNEGAKVYIDYNDNGTFETGEAVVSFPSNKDGTRTLAFTTPSSGVVFDKGLRLRVLSKFGSIPSTGCDISTYGQAEDYTVYFVSNAITTGTINSPLCQGTEINVPYTILRAFNAGNVFTAQLSDATGSFTTPVAIGTLTSTAAGTISATIPVSTPQGTAYRIRVVSSSPAIIGSPNAGYITINQNPVMTPTATPATIIAGASSSLAVSSDIIGTTFEWNPGVLIGTPVSVTPVTTTTYTVTGTAAGCTGSASVTVTVNPATKTLQVKVFIEGLYIGGGMMREALDFDPVIEKFPPKWGIGIADTVTVVLYDDT